MKKKTKKVTAIALLTMAIFGSCLSVQADSPKDIKPVIPPVVEQYETCSTPLCYDGQNLQKVIVTVTTYSDGTTKVEKTLTGVCCR